MQIALVLLAAVIVSASPAARQTTRISAPAKSPVTDADLLILREYNKATGVGSGTLPARYATEVRQRLSAMLDLAVVDAARSGAPLYLTRDAAAPSSGEIATGRSASAAPPALVGGEATFNALTVLGVRPALGRDFTEADVAASRHLALLTAGAWQRFFGSRPDVIGSMLWRRRPDGTLQPVEIVGVLPAGLLTATPELDPDLDVLVLADIRFDPAPADDRWFAPIVRLKPGVPLEAAQLAINQAVAAAQQELGAQEYARSAVRLDTLRRGR